MLESEEEPRQGHKFWNYLFGLQQSSILCDIQLCVKNENGEVLIYPAHKIVVAASSRYFQRCLSDGSLLDTYRFDGVGFEQLELVVDYIYRQLSWKDLMGDALAARLASTLEIYNHEWEAQATARNLHNAIQNIRPVIRTKTTKTNDRVLVSSEQARRLAEKMRLRQRRNRLLYRSSNRTTVVKMMKPAHATLDQSGEEAELREHSSATTQKSTQEHHKATTISNENEEKFEDDTLTDAGNVLSKSENKSTHFDSDSIRNILNATSPSELDASKPIVFKVEKQADAPLLKQSVEARNTKPEIIFVQITDGSNLVVLAKPLVTEDRVASETIAPLSSENQTFADNIHDPTKLIQFEFPATNDNAPTVTDVKEVNAATETLSEMTWTLKSEAVDNVEKTQTDGKSPRKRLISSLEEASPTKETADGGDGEIKTETKKSRRYSSLEDGLFCCSVCNKTLSEELSMQEHVQSCGINFDHKCPYCKFSCFTKRGLIKHLLRQHKTEIDQEDERIHECEHCEHLFKTTTDLDSHVASVHGKTSTFPCHECDMCFLSKSGLDSHMNSVHLDLVFECEMCGKTFRTEKYMHTHMRNTHKDGADLQCELCQKTFKLFGSLKRHLHNFHSDQRPFPCEICPSTFKTKEDMKKHVALHFKMTGRGLVEASRHQDKEPSVDGGYKCRICGKGYKNFYFRKAHEYIQHEEKESGVSYLCTRCNKSYTARHYLNMHIANVHKPKRMGCTQCNKAYQYKYELLRHLPRCRGYPEGPKPFTCHICGSQFTMKGNLTKHQNRKVCRPPQNINSDLVVVVQQTDGGTLQIPFTEFELYGEQVLQASSDLLDGEDISTNTEGSEEQVITSTEDTASLPVDQNVVVAREGEYFIQVHHTHDSAPLADV